MAQKESICPAHEEWLGGLSLEKKIHEKSTQNVERLYLHWSNWGQNSQRDHKAEKISRAWVK